MREIKFRGKSIEMDVTRGTWYYGSLDVIKDMCYIRTHELQANGYRAVLATQVEPESVGQFTDLYDKNGNEIYEKDIVKVICEEKSHIYQVIFLNGMFALNNPSCCEVCKEGNSHHGSLEEAFCLRDSIERIGNIFNNKYLNYEQ